MQKKENYAKNSLKGSNHIFGYAATLRNYFKSKNYLKIVWKHSKANVYWSR